MNYPYYTLNQSSILHDQSKIYDQSLSDASRLIIRNQSTATPVTKFVKRCHPSHSSHEFEEEECSEEGNTIGYLIKNNIQNLKDLKQRVEQNQILPNYQLKSVDRISKNIYHEEEDVSEELPCFGDEGDKDQDCLPCGNLFEYPENEENVCETESIYNEEHIGKEEEEASMEEVSSINKKDKSPEYEKCLDCLHDYEEDIHHCSEDCLGEDLTQSDMECLHIDNKDVCSKNNHICRWCNSDNNGICLSKNTNCKGNTKSILHSNLSEETIHHEHQEEEHIKYQEGEGEGEEEEGDNYQEEESDKYQEEETHIHPSSKDSSHTKGPTHTSDPNKHHSKSHHSPSHTHHGQPKHPDTHSPSSKTDPNKPDPSIIGPKSVIADCKKDTHYNYTQCEGPICCQNKDNNIYYQFHKNLCQNNSYDSSCCDTAVKNVEICKNTYREHFDFENPVSIVDKNEKTTPIYILISLLLLISILIYKYCR